jgi:hypothetical protein
MPTASELQALTRIFIVREFLKTPESRLAPATKNVGAQFIAPSQVNEHFVAGA